MSTTAAANNTAADDSMALQRLPSPPATPAAAMGLTPGAGHPVISADTFCYQYLSQISGLRCETIVCLMANGFDTIHTLLAIDPDVDLPVLADEGVPMAQRCLLRRALRELVDHYHRLRDQMASDGRQQPPVDPQLTTRQLLVEQFVRGEQQRHREFMSGLAIHLDDQSTATTAPVAPDGSVGNTTTDGYVSAAADYDDDDDSGDDGSGEGSGSADDKASGRSGGGGGGTDVDDSGDQTINKSTAPATEREARAARRDRSRSTMATDDSDDSDATRETNDNDQQLNPVSSGSDGDGGYENFMATSEYITQTQPNVVLSPLKILPLRVSQAKSQPTKTSTKKYNRAKTKRNNYNNKRNTSSSPEKAAKSVKTAAKSAKKVVKSSENVAKSNEKVVKSNKKVAKSSVKVTKGTAKATKTPIPLRTPCSVCNDTVKLTHQLGVWLCNGCYIFMRRVLRGERAPGDCREATGECVVNWDTRNHCAHCRYQKGLAVGVDPNSVFRVRSTASGVRRKPGNAAAANATAANNISTTSTTTTVSAIETPPVVTTAAATATDRHREVALDLNDGTDSIASIECGRTPTDEAPDRGYCISQPSGAAINGYQSPRKRVQPYSDTMATTSQIMLR